MKNKMGGCANTQPMLEIAELQKIFWLQGIGGDVMHVRCNANR